MNRFCLSPWPACFEFSLFRSRCSGDSTAKDIDSGAVYAADAVGDNVDIDITDVAAVDGNELLSFL